MYNAQTAMRDAGSSRETKTAPFIGNIFQWFTLELYGADRSKYIVFTETSVSNQA